MADIKVPELAESITEGTVAQWLKQPGDTVNKGDYVVELETDKVNVEIISEYSGVLAELKAEEGDTVNVGDTIAVVSEGGEAPAPKAEEKKRKHLKRLKKKRNQLIPNQRKIINNAQLLHRQLEKWRVKKESI